MYQALYRKWRPMRFADVIGQENITRTLRTQSAAGRLSHAYLFCGTRGTGKTTCARILAKAANCERPVDGDPCNECDACRGINDGSVTDVIELDAATYTGVSNIRELREEAVYSPCTVKKRVYIIDEVHMLSESAFNAFLKILEEPPAHVMFILATTELSKIPATILSRCQRFDFRRIPRDAIADRLMYISNAEGIPLEPSGAALLAHMADGAMRNALSLLEQASGRSSGPLDSESLSGLLGLVSTQPLLSAASMIAAGDAGGVISAFAERYAAGLDPAGYVDRLLCLMRDMLMIKTSPGAELMGSGYSAQDLSGLLGSYSPARLLYSIRLLQDCARSMLKSPNRRVDAEVCLVSLCNPSLGGDFSALAARIEALEQKLARGGVTLSAPAQPAPPAPSPAPAEDSAPPAPAAQPKKAAPEGFRTELIAALRDKLLMGELAYVKMCSMSLEGSTLTLSTPDPATHSFVSRQGLLSKISDAASLRLGRDVRAVSELRQAASDIPAGDALGSLLDFAAGNPEMTQIK